jgi:hypothetical protein
MRIKFEQNLKEIIVEETALYDREDFNLDISFDYNIDNSKLNKTINSSLNVREKSFIINIENLSLCFSGEKLRLSSIDMYTNSLNWIKRSVSLPMDYTESFCSVDETGQDERISYEEKIGCLFDNEKAIFKIINRQHG